MTMLDWRDITDFLMDLHQHYSANTMFYKKHLLNYQVWEAISVQNSYSFYNISCDSSLSPKMSTPLTLLMSKESKSLVFTVATKVVFRHALEPRTLSGGAVIFVSQAQEHI